MSILHDYFNAEIVNIYSLIHSKIWNAYNEIYNREEYEYKRSNEYNLLKKREYWDRPKEVIEQEALNDELSKLDYWLPRQNVSTKQSKITYCSNSYDVVDEGTPKGFIPSVSRIDYFKIEAEKIFKLVKHPFWVYMAKSISEMKFACEDIYDNCVYEDDYLNEEDEKNIFVNDLINILEFYDIHLKCSFYGAERKNIVVNGCRVIALRKEESTRVDLQIDVETTKTHKYILGCKENDVFRFPGIPITYVVKEIWK